MIPRDATAAAIYAQDNRTEWRAIEWLPNYAISEDGWILRTKAFSKFHPVGKIWHGAIDARGYRAANLTIAGRPRKLLIHRLVCEAWHGPPPFKDAHAAHGDGDTLNNHYSNLRWATQVENEADKLRHGTRLLGERHHSAILTEEQVREIRRTSKRTREVAEQYGVSYQAIWDIRNEKKWRHI